MSILPVSMLIGDSLEMLAFVDESGDSGLQPEKGSSRFFTVALVTFEERDEAMACDQRIDMLRREMGKPDCFEFHFGRNSHVGRVKFLKAVAPFGFFYHGLSLDKCPRQRLGATFAFNESLYHFTCRLVFEAAKPYLRAAIVVIDESGDRAFRDELSRFLKQRIRDGEQSLIRKVKMQRSHSNNLLQLADFVAGIMNRVVCNKPGAEDYRGIIAHHEMTRRVWP